MNKLLFFSLLTAWMVSRAVAGELSEQSAKALTKSVLESVEYDKDGNSKGSRPFTSDRRDFGITEIAIERSGCFGRCPVYTAKISRDGTVTYTGRKYVNREGSFQAQVSPYLFDNLAELAVKIGYRDFSPVYTAGVTDMATVYTRVTYTDRKVKIVSDYADCGPVTLWAFEELIDKAISEATDWKKVDPGAKSGAAEAVPGH
jgi:hypothetical protein